jgi:hypothetical protein
MVNSMTNISEIAKPPGFALQFAIWEPVITAAFAFDSRSANQLRQRCLVIERLH